MSSVGYGQDLGAFAQQHGLANSAAQNQYNSEIEAIAQAYNQGQISYDDATRQTATAGDRALLNYNKTGADVSRQAEQAGFDYTGNVLSANQQYNNAELAYRQNAQNLGFQKNQAFGQYNATNAQLSAQRQQAVRTQAYDNALYGVNLAGLQNQGAGYQTQLQNQLAGFNNANNQLWIGNTAAIGQAARDTNKVTTDFVGALPGYGPGTKSSTYSSSRRNSGTTARIGSGPYTAQAG